MMILMYNNCIGLFILLLYIITQYHINLKINLGRNNLNLNELYIKCIISSFFVQAINYVKK